jgi:hypothetical protein
MVLPLHATITIDSLTPSAAYPQTLGRQITWIAVATNTNPNALIFQFKVAFGSQPFTLARDFNIGTDSSGMWTSQPFTWTTITGEGLYTIQVTAKDLITGETATQTAPFRITTLAGSHCTVHRTANPLVALFSAPSCAAGSSMRVAFGTGSGPTAYTSWAPCNPPLSMNFYVAGMRPSSSYLMYSQVQTAGQTTDGSPLSFVTGALPATLPSPNIFPSFTVNLPAGAQTDVLDSTILWGFTNNVIPVATDLAGNIMWYYSGGKNTVVTRPLASGTMLTFQNGPTWSSANQQFQVMREIDFAGNTVWETNTGALAQQLTALRATDAASCLQVKNPAPVGTACLNDLSHDAIRFSVAGADYTALLAHVEKVFPAGTQGSDPKGPPVDIVSEMLIVLNSDWQAVWYYDSFQQLDPARAAVLGEICQPNNDCPMHLLLASTALDWTHANSIYYMAGTGDFLVSVRNQDWLIKVNYHNGAGAGNILWRMGPQGDFTFMNKNNDPWPWFSHQHEAAYENSGNGPMTLFDNGNTRVSAAPLGLGDNCAPDDCDSRGMALTVNETLRQVTPVLSADLGLYANAVGSAQLLSDGNYFFDGRLPNTGGIEILRTPGRLTGTQVLNITSQYNSYRAWRMSCLYAPPAS